MKKTFSFILAPFIFLLNIALFFIRVIGFASIIFAVFYVIQQTGIIPVRVPVSGASMLPTLPESGYVSFKRYSHINSFQPVIKHGDVVVFENEKTTQELQKQQKNASGFVKRVVGVAGDSVTIRDGYVYVNDEFVQEPYTLKSHSTFGGTEIVDCQAVVVPSGYVFVLGDNRKLSMDSRHVGLVSLKDVQFYIPYEDQKKQYQSKWRNASDDENSVATSNFQINDYLDLLNKERSKNQLKPLLLQSKLSASAQKRAQIMLEYDDLSFEATRSGYTMQKAMREVGYSNVVYGEFPIIGYYDAQELFDAFMENPNAKSFLLNENYEEIGVSTFVGKMNGCPVQVVVQHLAGYQPPNYKSTDINSWRNALNKLEDVKPGWESVKNSGDFYNEHKQDVDRINEIINLRISRIETIVRRIERNEWLTDEEKRFIEEDESLYEQQNRLADKLNTLR